MTVIILVSIPEQITYWSRSCFDSTTCGGSMSKGRTAVHRCAPTSAILENPSLCYYHSAKQFAYWDITLGEKSPFNTATIRSYPKCPFKGGMNQLWRNQLLATAIEGSSSTNWQYEKVYFSVVHHPGNHCLSQSMAEFHQLIDQSDRFFAFTSDQIINQAAQINSVLLNEWVSWYRELYYF